MLARQLQYRRQMPLTLNQCFDAECFDDNTVESYAMNRLGPSKADPFEEHLLVCPACSARAAEADEYVSLFRTAAIETCLGKD